MAGNAVNLEILTSIDQSVKALTDLQRSANKNFEQIQKDSLKAFSNSQSQASSNLKKIENGFTALKAVAVAAVGIFAGKALLGGIQDVIDAAAEEQVAIQKLNTALQLSGNFSKKASEDFVGFADSIEKTTSFSGEAVLSSGALLATMTKLSGDGLERATQAAVELSAAFGKDLNTTSQIVGKAIQGNTSGLKRLGIEVDATGSKAENLNIVLTKLAQFNGTAAQQSNTYTGAVTQLSNAFDDVKKSLGRIIVDNPAVVGGLKVITQGFGTLANFIDKNSDGLKKGIGEAIRAVIASLPTMLEYLQVSVVAVGSLVTGFSELAKGAVSFGGVIAGITGDDSAEQFYIDLYNTIEKGAQFSEKNIEKIGIAVEKLKPGARDLLKEFDRLGKQALTTGKNFKNITDPLEDDISLDGLEAVKGSFDKIKASADALTLEINKQNKSKLELIGIEQSLGRELVANAKAEIDANKKLSAADREASLARITEFQKLVDMKAALARDALSIGDLSVSDIQAKLKTAFSGGVSLSGLGTGLIDSITSGVTKIGEELKKVTLSDIATGIGNALSTGAQVLQGVLGGGYLSQISSFVSELGNAPSKFVEIAKGFKDLITNLLKSLPEVFKALTDELPKIFDKITDRLPKLAEAIIPIFQKLADVIAEKAPAFAAAILTAITKLVDAIPSIVDKLVKALPALLNAILQKIPALITAIARAIPQIVRSIAQVLPELINVLAKNIGPIVLALVQGILEAIPEIILVLVDEFIVKGGLFKIIASLIQAIPQIAIALVQGIVRAAFNSTGALMSYLGSSIGKGFSSAIKLPKFDLGDTRDVLSGKKFYEKMKELYEKYKDYLSGKKLFDKIKEAFNYTPPWLEKLKGILSGGLSGGGSGGAGGVVSRATGGIVKLNSGGTVYANQGLFVKRGSDTIPAMLAPGETVVSRAETNRLSEFLDRELTSDKSSQSLSEMVDKLAVRMLEILDARPVNVAVTVGEQQLATAVFNAKRRGFRI
jgi:phage-related protein